MKHLIWAALFFFVACGGAQTTPDPEPEDEVQVEDDSAPADERMREHFADVAAARDAVIDGDVEAVRGPLGRIAAAEYGADMPYDWRQWIGEMQESAGGYADVADLLAAATAVASLTESCADCHRTTLGGPAIPHEAEPVREDDLQGRMQRHDWGVEQLWLGLTAPSHEAWARGAQAVIGDPVRSDDSTTNEAVAPHLEELRALGVRAQEAGQPADKAAVYAELISKCAICHSGLDGRR